MNGYLFIGSMTVGLIGSILEILHVKNTKRIIPVYLILFFLAAVSSINGNMRETDLGAYLTYFVNHKDSYFAFGYVWFTNILHIIIRNSRLGYVISIVLINITMSCLCARELDISKKYFLTYLVLFNSYWGISFSIEIIRTGLAIAFSVLAAIMANQKKTLTAVLLMLVSISFHITEILLVPFILMLLFKENSNKIKVYKYIIWAGVLIFCDNIGFGYTIFNLIKTPVENLLRFFNAYSHYHVYVGGIESELMGGVSKQYVFYYLLGLSLVYLQKYSKGNKLFLDGYFIGLSVRTFFTGFGTIIRIQWVYLVFSVLVIYNYMSMKTTRQTNKIVYISALSIAQSIMAMLYLDVRF